MSPITRREFVQGAALAPLAVPSLSSLGRTATPADRFDIVVASAGHNSLITTAYLAKAGYRCLVLEGRPASAAASRRPRRRSSASSTTPAPRRTIPFSTTRSCATTN